MCTNVHAVCIRVNEFQYTNNELSSCIPSGDNVFASNLQCVCQFMLLSCTNKMKRNIARFRPKNQPILNAERRLSIEEGKIRSICRIDDVLCIVHSVKSLEKGLLPKSKNIQIHRKNLSIRCQCSALAIAQSTMDHYTTRTIRMRKKMKFLGATHWFGVQCIANTANRRRNNLGNGFCLVFGFAMVLFWCHGMYDRCTVYSVDCLSVCLR